MILNPSSLGSTIINPTFSHNMYTLLLPIMPLQSHSITILNDLIITNLCLTREMAAFIHSVNVHILLNIISQPCPYFKSLHLFTATLKDGTSIALLYMPETKIHKGIFSGFIWMQYSRRKIKTLPGFLKECVLFVISLFTSFLILFSHCLFSF